MSAASLGIELIGKGGEAIHGVTDLLHAARPITAVARRHGVDQRRAHGGQRRRHVRPEHRLQLVEPRGDAFQCRRDLRVVLVAHVRCTFQD